MRLYLPDIVLGLTIAPGLTIGLTIAVPVFVSTLGSPARSTIRTKQLEESQE